MLNRNTADAVFEFGWAVGLFEGEGCINVYQKDHVQLTVVSTDHDTVLRFHRIVEVGTVTGPFQPNGNPKWKPAMKWTCSHQHEACAVLEAMLPYLGERRRQKAQEAIDLFYSRPRRNIRRQRHLEAT